MPNAKTAFITPERYIKERESLRERIAQLRAAEFRAFGWALNCPLPENLRAATADDIKPGQVVWYKDGDDGPFWQIVNRPEHYGDAFKAYTAEDGSRYGLDDAWIEVKRTRRIKRERGGLDARH